MSRVKPEDRKRPFQKRRPYYMNSAELVTWMLANGSKQENGCIYHPFKVSPKVRGYAIVRCEGRQKKAHRLVFSHFNNGEQPESVCHRCDNPRCIEPTHLFGGTHQDNMTDMQQKKRAKGFSGSANPIALLTEDQVREIRQLYSAGGISQWGLARKFGVKQSCISGILLRRSWRHIA